ncbi:MAG: helix-turn-helix domain-containing protein [Bullifex sp.]
MQKKTENIRTVRESYILQQQMSVTYCREVQEHSLRNHSRAVAAAITMIDYDITAYLSLSAVSKECGVTPSYLSAVFSKEMGTTITMYVRQKRLEHAAYLPNGTDMRIQDVGEMCGLDDASYFTRLFTSWTGMSPREYREKRK